LWCERKDRDVELDECYGCARLTGVDESGSVLLCARRNPVDRTAMELNILLRGTG
jgi:hypothetical protein